MKKFIILSLAALLAVSVSCKKNDLFTITTIDVTWVGKNDVTMHGSYSVGKDLIVEEYGFVVNGHFGDGEKEVTVASESGSNAFYVSLFNLLPGKKYSYTAYAVVDGKFQYGEKKYFWTFTEEGYKKTAVDFGTGVVWAVSNVGAASPEIYGDYFAWGDPEPKVDYTVAAYNGPGATALTDETDPCTIKLGGFWRTPTFDEYKALIEATTRMWTKENGVNGLRLTGKEDFDKKIFFPAAGSYYPQPNGLMGKGVSCEYASSSLKEDGGTNPVWGLKYDSSTGGVLNMMLFQLHWGISYRAVMDTDKYKAWQYEII